MDTAGYLKTDLHRHFPGIQQAVLVSCLSNHHISCAKDADHLSRIEYFLARPFVWCIDTTMGRNVSPRCWIQWQGKWICKKGSVGDYADFFGRHKHLIPWARIGEPRTDSQDPETGKKLWAWLEDQVKDVWWLTMKHSAYWSVQSAVCKLQPGWEGCHSQCRLS